MNMRLQISFQIRVFVSLNKHPEVALQDHMVVLLLYSVLAVPIYIPTDKEKEVPFLHILTNICYFFSFLITLILKG